MRYLNNVHIILITSSLLFLIAFFTVPSDILDATDVKDYSDTAKFFAGEYNAKHRAAHSIVYGLLLSPYVKLAESFAIIKLASAFWLVLLIISIYYISGKNRKALLLIIFSPLVWYMSPWLSPVPIVSLLFLWAYFFLNKLEQEEKNKYVIYSGILIGLASSLWDSALYFSFIFLCSFFYNRKFKQTWLFALSIIIGLMPRLIIDQIFFNFAFYGILKNFLALISFALFGGVYDDIYSVFNIGGYIIILIFIPIYFFALYKKEILIKHKTIMIFLTLCLMFILLNPHIRMLIVIAPIMFILMAKELDEKKFNRQIMFSIILALLVILPFIIQFRYETNARTLEKAIAYSDHLYFTRPFTVEIIRGDLDKISQDYPNSIFVVGNKRDDYKALAHMYWGERIKEFISLEDYNLFLQNKTTIAEKRISSNADSRFRTELWFEVGLRKNSNDITDYKSIQYAISLEENLDLPNFKLIKKYNRLSVFEKISYPKA
ncbi:MAG: hypothetical protein Q7S27_06815 [Nanoarchaeota archaeon]|nr:hypothetical protein [Nanoarchaeota archaeon]